MYDCPDQQSVKQSKSAGDMTVTRLILDGDGVLVQPQNPGAAHPEDSGDYFPQVCKDMLKNI